MKELKLREDKGVINYIDEITDGSFVGMKGNEENVYVTKKEDNRFIGLSKKYPNIDTKWSTETKLDYVLEYLEDNKATVYIFKSEAELIEWFLK